MAGRRKTDIGELIAYTIADITRKSKKDELYYFNEIVHNISEGRRNGKDLMESDILWGLKAPASVE